MKSVTVRNIPIRCFVSDSKCTLLIVGLPPSWTPAQLKVELERIGGPMIGEPSVVKPGQVHANYINYRRAEKALALLSGKPCGTTPGGPIMNASLAQGKPPPKIPGAAPPATLFIKNIAGSIDEAGLAKCQCIWMLPLLMQQLGPAHRTAVGAVWHCGAMGVCDVTVCTRPRT